jgi:transposase
VGLDVHKNSVSFCVKLADGQVIREGSSPARRDSLRQWAASLDRPWVGAMEATLFTGWIYDLLKPLAVDLKVAHPYLLRAIAASKKKNDRIDASKIADALRADLLPECYMAPSEIRELRRVLRFRNLLVAQAVRMMNKTSGLLMEVGAPYSKSKLHGKRYFRELLARVEEVPPSVRQMVQISHSYVEAFGSCQKQLVRALRENPLIRERVERLQTIRGVGQVTALTWVLEVGDPHRFGSIAQAQSYCGLTSAQKESAGKSQRGPISKQRNRHLQTVLVEAAKIAPRYNPQLREVQLRERERGNRNRATLAVARKIVAYMLCVDKSAKPFQAR